MINSKRINLIQQGTETNGPVIYWMSRDQRLHDNWAVLFAQQLAGEKNRDFVIVFNLVPEFLEASIRQYDFMLKGLQETEEECRNYNIPFKVLTGNPADTIPLFIKELNASILISDFDPLKIKKKWKQEIQKKISVPFYEVDAHNIVPVWSASQKQEFAAYTIRPKITKQLPEFLEEFPLVKKYKKNESLSFSKIDWRQVKNALQVERNVKENNKIIPGSMAALDELKNFLNNKFESYASDRNDPNKNALSNLSPYLHFGQISAHRIALEVKSFERTKESEEAYLDELIIRKELSDNFCYYNENYDLYEGFPAWAKETLSKHINDKREHLYDVSEFEKAATHEDLWNAAQNELVRTGKMHGYMRMYWAKKILEWSKTPAEALKTAIYLNDKYSIDGRDPNGYTGCAWSIGGVHDRAWFERDVFGKIRYMNRNGAKNKFDIDEYIKRQK